MAAKIYNTRFEREKAKRREKLVARYAELQRDYPGKSKNWYYTALANDGAGGLYSRSWIRRVLMAEELSTSSAYTSQRSAGSPAQKGLNR